MILNNALSYQSFEKILIVIIVILFSLPAYEFTQNRGSPQEADDRYAYEIKATNFDICFVEKDCLGLNSFYEFLENKNVVKYISDEKKNRDIQRIFYSYHPLYSVIELTLKKILNNNSKFILILLVNMFILFSIYSLCIFFFNKEIFYLTSIILFFNPIFPGLISGYPYILSTGFALLSLVNLEKKNYIIHYILLLLGCLSHIFGIFFLGFFVILNYIRHYIFSKSILKTFNNIEIHLRTLIYIIIFLVVYFFQIKFTHSTLIDEPKFLEWNYLFSIENISVMFMEKLFIISNFLYPVYSLHFILFLTFLLIISIFTILFFSYFRNLSINLKSIFFSLIIYFTFLMIFPNYLIMERFLPFYSIILVSLVIFSVLKLNNHKKIGLYLLSIFLLISIVSGSNFLLNKKIIFEHNQDLVFDEKNIKKYSDYSNSLFLFDTTEALFYKFLISGIQKNNFFLNISNAKMDISKLEKKFDNIFLIINSELIDISKSLISSDLNKKLTIESKNNKISNVSLLTLNDTILTINKKNFEIKANKILNININMLNKFELTSQDKVYLLKLYDSKKIPIIYLDVFVNDLKININNRNITNKIKNFESNACSLKIYDVLYTNLIYKIVCS